MDFVLTLHSHLPYVLGHGRWPHGSDWLCEAALDTYLPLLCMLRALEIERVPTPVTLGLTPVLAEQLAHPAFAAELEAFIAQRLAACDEAPAALAATGDQHLEPLLGFWRARFRALRDRFREEGGDLSAAFRRYAERGRIELIASAATHGYLPLLGREESIRLQLLAGRSEHRRLFGTEPVGCWLPECAYRPAGRWAPPGALAPRWRRGTDEHLRDAGYRYFFVDAHVARAGGVLGQYAEVPLGAERFDAGRPDTERGGGRAPDRAPAPERTPYRPYRLAGAGEPVAVFVRDPRSSMQVWSRRHGYPGDGAYLEFHKIRPGGLKLWRVTDPDADLDAKAPYAAADARERARVHADHYASVLHAIAAAEWHGRVIVAPFDTELFGHWWFEGADFLADLFRALAHGPVRPVTAGTHLRMRPAREVIDLAHGSWGSNGDDTMWMNEGTAWMWQRLWPLEDAFWTAAPTALADETRRAVLAQAARSLLLAQASDWPFVVSTGTAGDYAAARFQGHCDDCTALLEALAPGADAGAVEAGVRQAAALRGRDDVFPDVLESVQRSLG
jgi:1,4-alpha-glucan branching enzyme